MNPLLIEPRPLIFSNRPVVLAWSPKSACTHALIWFLRQESLLPAANYYSGWPHQFRMHVYYASEVYARRARALEESGGRGYTLLRVVRDPVKRMVSIFRHVVRHRMMAAELSAFLGRDIAATGLSLVELHAFLRTLPLMQPCPTDSHVCAQFHPIWTLGWDRVITLNADTHALNAGLNLVERELGLSHTDFATIRKFEAIGAHHYARRVPYAGSAPVETVRFTAEATREFPKDALEAAPYTAAMARELHGVDLPNVRTGDSWGRLAFAPAAEAAA